jgi:4-amino-4-deoxy-L-arabinose transferase-like glycosyltransferase
MLRENALGAQIATMFYDRTNRNLASILRSPTLAVVTAYALRMFLLWLSQRSQVPPPGFQPVGLEEGMVAMSLVKGKGFFGPFPGYDALTAWLAPVYPFLWALFYKVFRMNSEGLNLLGQTMNCVFAAATCWPVYSIAKRLFGEKIGLATAWAWAFLPFAILMPLEWDWDQSLSALVLALVVDVTLRLRDSMSPLPWSSYGLLWGFAALVNPALCGLLPFALAWLVIRRRQTGAFSPALYARVVVFFVLSVLPWTIRNYEVAQGWVFIKSNFGVELWIGNHPASYQKEVHPIYSFSERMSLIMEGEAQYGKSKERQAIAYIEAHPGEFLKKSCARILDTWSAREDAWNDGWVKALHLSREYIWLCSLFSVLAFAGLVLSLNDAGWDSLPVALCLVVFPIPYYITHTAMRYRHPIDPLMTIFAVYAIAKLWSAVAPRPAMEKLETSTAS